MDQKQDLQERIERFRELSELNPGSRYFAPLADLLRQDGRHDEALVLLDEGLVEDPDYRAALVIRGRTLQETGRADEARDCWLRVLDGDPENILALESLSVEALDACEWSGAVPLLERLVALTGEDSIWTGSLLEARGHLARQKKEGAAEVEQEIQGDAESEPPQTAQAIPKPNPEIVSDRASGPQTENDPASSFDTMTLVDIYLAQGYRERALAVLRRMLPGAGESEEEIRERIRLLETVDGKTPVSPTDRERATVPGNDGPEPATAADRERREQERARRRESERKRFEEWLEKIRFNGERGE